MANKTVKIDFKTFIALARYFTLEEHTNELYGQIKADIDCKIDNLVKHELYTVYKTAETEEEREKARLEYLDKIGMRDSFRW